MAMSWPFSLWSPGADMSVRVAASPIDLDAEMQAVSAVSAATGAVVTFSGHVRADEPGAPVSALYLEHYPAMTESALLAIEGEACQRWPVIAARLVHRVGELAPGELIVFVAVASRHRQDAFLAASYIMDQLKTRAPFWKRETRNGQTHWVEAKDSDAASAERWRS